MKATPKQVAEKEVFGRIVTKEKAKSAFIKWIDKSLKNGVFTEDVIKFWNDVKKETEKL